MRVFPRPYVRHLCHGLRLNLVRAFSDGRSPGAGRCGTHKSLRADPRFGRVLEDNVVHTEKAWKLGGV